MLCKVTAVIVVRTIIIMFLGYYDNVVFCVRQKASSIAIVMASNKRETGGNKRWRYDTVTGKFISFRSVYESGTHFAKALWVHRIIFCTNKCCPFVQHKAEIRSSFCAYHDSSAVVICPNWLTAWPKIEIKAKLTFPRFELWAHWRFPK